MIFRAVLPQEIEKDRANDEFINTGRRLAEGVVGYDPVRGTLMLFPEIL